MSLFSRAIKIRNPFPKVKWVERYETTRKAVAIVVWSSLVFVIVAAFALAGTYWCLVRLVSPPPKVVTQVVHETALTAAQNEFIKQCEQTSQEAANTTQMNNGVPDVHTSPWTCSFPK